MASDIQPGDLVVCVNTGPIPCPGPLVRYHTGEKINVKKGGVYRVSSMAPVIPRPPHRHAGQACGCVSLLLTDGSHALIQRFRKLNDEPDNIELVRQIKACKPISEPALTGAKS